MRSPSPAAIPATDSRNAGKLKYASSPSRYVASVVGVLRGVIARRRRAPARAASNVWMGIVRSRKGGACRRSCGRREKEIVPGELGRVQYPVGDGAQTEGWQVVWVVGPGQFGSRSLQRAQHDVIADRA